VIAIRAVLLAIALAACVWFALGARAAHDQDAATNVLNARSTLSGPEAKKALSLIDDARTLNPDQSLNILRAQVELHSGHPHLAVAIAKAVVAKEPLNADGWFVLELLSRQVDPALNRLAQARLRQLVAPVT
jgi:predicted Zn-dependent protease